MFAFEPETYEIRDCCQIGKYYCEKQEVNQPFIHYHTLLLFIDSRNFQNVSRKPPNAKLTRRRKRSEEARRAKL
jgi:hypothetical protein